MPRVYVVYYGSGYLPDGTKQEFGLRLNQVVYYFSSKSPLGKIVFLSPKAGTAAVEDKTGTINILKLAELSPIQNLTRTYLQKEDNITE